MIRTEVRLADPGTLRRQINRSVSRVMLEKADALGRRMVENANAGMANQGFNLSRPPERRRYPGSRRAATALDYYVEGKELPITVGFRILGGEEVFKRILGMNYPIPPHEIWPHGGWDLSGAARRTGASPKVTKLNARYLIGDKLAWPDPNYKNGWRVFPSGQSVWWYPGRLSGGTYFLQDARDKAIDEIL
jgi:hypothetical protein